MPKSRHEEAQMILKEARYGRKRDYREYEYFKQRLQMLNLDYITYEAYIKKLAKVLEV